MKSTTYFVDMLWIWLCTHTYHELIIQVDGCVILTHNTGGTVTIMMMLGFENRRTIKSSHTLDRSLTAIVGVDNSATPRAIWCSRLVARRIFKIKFCRPIKRDVSLVVSRASHASGVVLEKSERGHFDSLVSRKIELSLQ